MSNWRVIQGDVLSVLPTLAAGSVHTCVTSPPYWGLRDYGVDGQIGLESTPAEYVARMVEVFAAVRRVLRDDGTLWLNLGDSYASVGKWGGSTGGKHVEGLHGDEGVGRGRRDYGELKGKDLVGIPWRVAFALQADGWYLRSDIIWHKPNPMPESVTDRPTKAHEYIFLLAKAERYHYDAGAIAEPCVGTGGASFGKVNRMEGAITAGQGARRNTLEDRQRYIEQGRNKRDVWTVNSQSYSGAHFATFPEALIEPCILAGCPIEGTVLDPFNGSGTTGAVSVRHGRNYVGVELNPEYVALAERRIGGEAPLFTKGGAA